MRRKASKISWGSAAAALFVLAAGSVFLTIVWEATSQPDEVDSGYGAAGDEGAEQEELSRQSEAITSRPGESGRDEREATFFDEGNGRSGDRAKEDSAERAAAAADWGADSDPLLVDMAAGGEGEDSLLIEIIRGDQQSQYVPDQDVDSQPSQPASVIELGAVLEVPAPVGEGAVSPVFGLPGRKTEHFTIYSQLSEQATVDIALRLEAMYDYYAERFSDVYSPIPFEKSVFLFNNRASFVAAGGHPTMPGQFMSGGDGAGARLMMIFQEGNIGAFMSSCPLMYHEGFHQFQAIEISEGGNPARQWPLWLDEAYATVFNNIVWTGDGWVDGMIRLEYADSSTNSADGFIKLDKLLSITGAEWHQMTNAGQIWPVYMEGMSLIYFLNNANNGRHSSLLDNYVEQLSTGKDASRSARRIAALQSSFGRWHRKSMNIHITGAKYYEVLTALATSQLARAHAKGQRFLSGGDFLDKARASQLRMAPVGDDQWLPDSLRQELLYYHNSLTASHQAFKFEITYATMGAKPVLRVSQPRFGLILEGTFELDGDGNVESVDVEYIKCPSLDLAIAKKKVGTRD